jgi:fructokinase
LAQLAAERNLVHGDFNGSNLLVQCVPDKWCVAAVLDWEFAISGSPLNDAGNFLRYERAEGPLLEPHFSAGYLDAGGRLPHDWRRLAQILDLTAICQRLTRPQPDPEVSKLVEAVRATVG